MAPRSRSCLPLQGISHHFPSVLSCDLLFQSLAIPKLYPRPATLLFPQPGVLPSLCESPLDLSPISTPRSFLMSSNRFAINSVSNEDANLPSFALFYVSLTSPAFLQQLDSALFLLHCNYI